MQTILSYAIRYLLDPEAQRKLAKGLNAMIARGSKIDGTPQRRPYPEGDKALLDGPMTEAEKDDLTTMPGFLRREPKEAE